MAKISGILPVVFCFLKILLRIPTLSKWKLVPQIHVIERPERVLTSCTDVYPLTSGTLVHLIAFKYIFIYLIQ
jgi:hypothetical protein